MHDFDTRIGAGWHDDVSPQALKRTPNGLQTKKKHRQVALPVFNG